MTFAIVCVSHETRIRIGDAGEIPGSVKLEMRLLAGRIGNPLKSRAIVCERCRQTDRISNGNEPSAPIVDKICCVSVAVDDRGLETLRVEMNLRPVLERSRVRSVGISRQYRKLARRRCERVGASGEKQSRAVTADEQHATGGLEMELLEIADRPAGAQNAVAPIDDDHVAGRNPADGRIEVVAKNRRFEWITPSR